MKYINISDGVIGDDLFIIRFSHFNCKLHDIINSVLKSVKDDDYIIYSTNVEAINILGKFSLSKEHISTSRYFQSFIESSEVLTGDNPSQMLNKASYICVTNCIFDISLNNKQYLKRIFNFIINSNTAAPDFIWMDDTDLLFYPIKNNMQKILASHYFSLMLFNRENAPK